MFKDSLTNMEVNDQNGSRKAVQYSRREELFYEYHWYEHYGIGRFETKLKVVTEK